jgi:hypothetical protein
MVRRLAMLFWCVVWATGTLRVQAQAPISLEVKTDQAKLDFPNKITFTLQATSSEIASQVFLEYGTSGRSCVEGVARQEADLTPGSPFKATWTWDFKFSGSLPVGAEVWWLWDVRTESGQVLRTEKQTLVIEDPTLTWKRIENDQVIVVWSDGSASFAQRILNLATTSLARLAREAGISPSGQVRLTVYPSFDTLRSAVLFIPEWTGGLAFPEYGVIMLGIASDSGDWMVDVVPHELAHLVSGEQVFNCLGVSMPTWLSEGISVYAEAADNPDEAKRVLNALENGKLPPLHNLEGGFSANADETNLSYAQSGEVVRFLIREYGAEKMSALLSAIQSGLRINAALQQVYGFDTDGLDNTWRSLLGFETIGSADTPTATSARTAVPTLALWTSVVRSSPTSTQPTEATETPIAVAAAASNTPEVVETAEPSPSVGSTSESVVTPTKKPGSGGLPCLGGVALNGVFLFLLTKLPAARRKQ